MIATTLTDIVITLGAVSFRRETLAALQHEVSALSPAVRLRIVKAERSKPVGVPEADAPIDLLIDFDRDRRSQISSKQRWSIIIGRKRPDDGTKPGMWEILAGDAVIHTAIVAKRDAADPNLSVLKHGALKVHQHSRYLTERDAVEAAFRLLPDAFRATLTGAFVADTGYAPPILRRTRMTLLDRIRYQAVLARNILAKNFRSAFIVEWWHVGHTRDGLAAHLAGSANIIWVKNSRRSEFRADPFPALVTADSVEICYGYYDWRSRKGNLRRMSVGRKGSLLADDDMNDMPWHQSHPFLPHYHGKAYCIPESAESNDMLIFEFDTRTGKLSNPQPLVPGFPGLDAALCFWDDLWWLFCTRKGEGNSSLYLWHAVDPLGEWTPHPQNPVKVDVRSARPAGNIIKWKDGLLRPAQDCARTYGGAIVFNRIARVSTTEYDESEIARIGPFRDLRDGAHTVNELDGLITVDAKRETFSLYPLWTTIYSRLLRQRGTRLKPTPPQNAHPAADS